MIRQALPADALQRFVGAHCIVNAKADAVGIAEIKFAKVAVQVLLAASGA
jgi:hypothetical protein